MCKMYVIICKGIDDRMKNRRMKTPQRILVILYFIFWLNIYFIVPAHAYIDPATTAMVTQIVAGIFISAGVLFGVFRRKVILFFKNISVKRTQRKIVRKSKNENTTS